MRDQMGGGLDDFSEIGVHFLSLAFLSVVLFWVNSIAVELHLV